MAQMNLCLICVISFLGVSTTHFTGRSGRDAEFEAYIDKFWLWQQQQAPDYYSTYNGLDFESTLIEQFNEPTFEWRKDNATDLLSELHGLVKVDLSENNVLNYELIEYTLQTIIDGYEFVSYGAYNPNNINEMTLMHWIGMVSGAMDSEAEQTVQGVEKIITWYEQMPKQIDDIIKLMNISIARGTVNHWAAMTGVLSKYEAEVAKGANESTFLAPFTDMYLEKVTENQAERDRLQQEGRTLVETNIASAWERYTNFLRDEYMPNTRVHEGVWSIPNGEYYYRTCLNFHLTFKMTPEEVNQLGLSEVTRLDAAMLKEVQSYGDYSTVDDFLQWYRVQPDSFYKTSEELMAGYNRIVDTTHPKLSQMMYNVPEMPLEVVENPNPDAPAGFYGSPSLDGSTPGMYIINTADLSASPKMDMISLTMHEAEPGHHTQTSYSLLSENFPMFRRVMFWYFYMVPFMWPMYSTYVEGWALYCEFMAEEFGAYTDTIPYSKLGKLNYEMWRATRLVVDTGIHYYGWTRQEAIDYMAAHTTFDEIIISNEVDRYIAWPGQACAYKIGELKIRELRSNAETQLGARFDLRAFHDEVLKLGPVPITMLETHITAWVDGLNTTPIPTPSQIPDTTPTSASSRNKPLALLPALLVTSLLAIWRCSTYRTVWAV